MREIGDNCPKCGHSIVQGDNYCTKCGVNIKDEIEKQKKKFLCPNCGKKIDKLYIYCPNCGYKLKEKYSKHPNDPWSKPWIPKKYTDPPFKPFWV